MAIGIMSENFEFKLIATDGMARRGEITMPRGTVRTPAFMPVGTGGTVKAIMVENGQPVEFDQPLVVVE